MNGNKLKAKIVERGLNVEKVASLIDMTRSSLYRKLNSSTNMTICEAIRIKDVLELTDEEANAIFFG